MNTNFFLENAELHAYLALFSDTCSVRAERLKEQYREKNTRVIYEAVLTESKDTCDISFHVDTDKKPLVLLLSLS